MPSQYKPPSQVCKDAGLKSMAELPRILGDEITRRALVQWAHTRPTVLRALALGAAQIKNEES